MRDKEFGQYFVQCLFLADYPLFFLSDYVFQFLRVGGLEIFLVALDCETYETFVQELFDIVVYRPPVDSCLLRYLVRCRGADSEERKIYLRLVRAQAQLFEVFSLHAQ